MCAGSWGRPSQHTWSPKPWLGRRGDDATRRGPGAATTSAVSPAPDPNRNCKTKSLSVRTHICPRCGLVLDRDANAARNILESGRAGPSGGNVARWGERSLRSPAL
jgi:Putative transposase DNA-binding domain